DIIAFDSSTVRDRATYQQPTLLATGMRYVTVNGTLAIDGGNYTGAMAGRALRRVAQSRSPMFPSLTPWVKRLIVANVAVFVVTTYFVPGLGELLAFYPHWAYIVRMPWTFVTYMFVHAGWSHILFNMISLWFFGPRVEEQMGG